MQFAITNMEILHHILSKFSATAAAAAEAEAEADDASLDETAVAELRFAFPKGNAKLWPTIISHIQTAVAVKRRCDTLLYYVVCHSAQLLRRTPQGFVQERRQRCFFFLAKLEEPKCLRLETNPNHLQALPCIYRLQNEYLLERNLYKRQSVLRQTLAQTTNHTNLPIFTLHIFALLLFQPPGKPYKLCSIYYVVQWTAEIQPAPMAPTLRTPTPTTHSVYIKTNGTCWKVRLKFRTARRGTCTSTDTPMLLMLWSWHSAA